MSTTLVATFSLPIIRLPWGLQSSFVKFSNSDMMVGIKDSIFLLILDDLKTTVSSVTRAAKILKMNALKRFFQKGSNGYSSRANFFLNDDSFAIRKWI